MDARDIKVNADGTFNSRVTPGWRQIWISALGFGRESFGPRQVRDGEAWDIGDVRLSPPAIIVIHASLPDGMPWPPAARRAGDGAMFLPIHAELTDAEGVMRDVDQMREPGRIEFLADGAGRYRLTVHGEGFASEPVDVLARDGATSDAYVRLVAGVRHEFRAIFTDQRPTWAEVEVLDAQRLPLARLPLSITPDGVGVVARDFVAGDYTGRLYAEGELAPEVPFEHKIAR